MRLCVAASVAFIVFTYLSCATHGTKVNTLPGTLKVDTWHRKDGEHIFRQVQHTTAGDILKAEKIEGLTPKKESQTTEKAMAAQIEHTTEHIRKDTCDDNTSLFAHPPQKQGSRTRTHTCIDHKKGTRVTLVERQKSILMADGMLRTVDMKHRIVTKLPDGWQKDPKLALWDEDANKDIERALIRLHKHNGIAFSHERRMEAMNGVSV